MRLRRWTRTCLWSVCVCCCASLSICVGGAVEPTPARLPDLPVTAPAVTVASLSLEQFVALGLAKHPRLVAAGHALEQAHGRAWQAKLYPNPIININFDELGDRTGPGGVNHLPLVSQEIVTGGKRQLDQAAACKQVDQASLLLVAQRAQLLANIRLAYFETLGLQQRREVLAHFAKQAELGVEQTRKLLEAKSATRIDLLQSETELEKLRAELEALDRELPLAYRRLAATVGTNELLCTKLEGSLESPLPEYDLEKTQQHVLGASPEIKSAHLEVDRAHLLLQRAEAEPIPNLTLEAGYVRQNQNKSNDFTLGVSFPLPVWNRNQGNIRTACGRLGEAQEEIRRAEYELSEKFLTSLREYVASKKKAERYRSQVLPRVTELYELSTKAYQAGKAEYMTVLVAQKALVENYLEYYRALADAWKAGSMLSGYTLEEHWPVVAVPIKAMP